MTTLADLKVLLDDGVTPHPGRVRSAARKLPLLQADALLDAIDQGTVSTAVDQILQEEANAQ